MPGLTLCRRDGELFSLRDFGGRKCASDAFWSSDCVTMCHGIWAQKTVRLQDFLHNGDVVFQWTGIFAWVAAQSFTMPWPQQPFTFDLRLISPSLIVSHLHARWIATDTVGSLSWIPRWQSWREHDVSCYHQLLWTAWNWVNCCIAPRMVGPFECRCPCCRGPGTTLRWKSRNLASCSSRVSMIFKFENMQPVFPTHPA
jgi:hypothetical protein